PIYEHAQPGTFSLFGGGGHVFALPRYARVRFAQVYTGIDLVYYVSESGSLQFDFLLAPGADPGRIKLDVPHNADLRLVGGAAQLQHGATSVRLAAPAAWQSHAGRR